MCAFLLADLDNASLPLLLHPGCDYSFSFADRDDFHPDLPANL